MAQVATRGFRATVERHLLCFAMFWHALDIIWIWLFTVVYLMGIRPMTETRYDRAPGDSPALSGPKESTVRRGRLHDRTSSSRDPHGHVFWVANTSLLLGPGIPLGLAVLAIAQMGVHLVFFLTSPSDRTTPTMCWRLLLACSSWPWWSPARCGSWRT
jgi:hypothetical protein